jgi:hypothetical protein
MVEEGSVPRDLSAQFTGINGPDCGYQRARERTTQHERGDHRSGRDGDNCALRETYWESSTRHREEDPERDTANAVDLRAQRK